jgi:hypothetical protein
MQILTPAVLLMFLPGLMATHGLAAPFLIVAVSAIALVWVYRHYPADGAQKAGGSALLGTRRALFLGAAGLVGVFVFFGGQSTVWSFVERMGMHSGFLAEVIGRALSISAVAGLVGALSASIFGNRYGRVLPLVLSMFGTFVGVAILIQTRELGVYTAGLCLVCAAWNYSAPYLQGAIANLDRSGRMLALLAIIMPGSMSAGPALATLFLSEGGGYMPIVWMLAIALPLGFLLVYPAARLKT